MSDEKKGELAPTGNGEQPPTTNAAGLVALFMPDDRRAYCSFDLATPRGRELLQKCEEAPDEPVRELANRRINLQHVYAKMVDMVNPETSEVRTVLRICLIDADGSVHGCASEGIRQALARIMAGHKPPPWNPPVPVEVKLKALANKNQRLTLLEVFDRPKGGK